MRKRIISPVADSAVPPKNEWLDLDEIAQVEISSEDSAHPIEAALVPGAGSGWMAAQSGEQTLRLLFDEPQTLKLIRLVFSENKRQRTQQFVLRWSGDGAAFHDVVRQQYNFSPGTTEVEEYSVKLVGVTALALSIVPDIGGGDARASLTELRLA